MTRPESPESKPLGFPKTDILSISPAGDLAVMLDAHTGTGGYWRTGTLARMPLVGGSPRPILEDVRYADWAPNGKDLAVTREADGLVHLEYPIGKVVHQSEALVNPRVSHDGNLVAFFDNSRGPNVSISLVNKAGKVRVLSDGWKDWWNLSWSPDGTEVWFAAPVPGASRDTSALYAVNLSGKVRLLARVPGTLELHDTSKDGRALVGRIDFRGVARGMLAGAAREQDLSWLNSSNVTDLSNDGKTVLVDEEGEGGGPNGSIYLRKADGSAPTLIGEGASLALSVDGKWVLALLDSQGTSRFALLPTGSGNPIDLKTDGLSELSCGNLFPDGRRLLVCASESGHAGRLYVVPIEGGTPKPISPEGFSIKGFGNSISPDGRFVAAIDAQKRAWILPTDGGEGKLIAGMEPGEVPLQFSSDGRSLYLLRGGEVPGKIWRLDLATAKRDFVLELTPADPAGVTSLEAVLITPDGRSYAYSYHNNLSDLYLVDGLK
jgi:Tol biopolymer transport system component